MKRRKIWGWDMVGSLLVVNGLLILVLSYKGLSSQRKTMMGKMFGLIPKGNSSQSN